MATPPRRRYPPNRKANPTQTVHVTTTQHPTHLDPNLTSEYPSSISRHAVTTNREPDAEWEDKWGPGVEIPQTHVSTDISGPMQNEQHDPLTTYEPDISLVPYYDYNMADTEEGADDGDSDGGE